MATRDSQRARNTSANHARVEQAAHLAGMTEAMVQAAEFAPQVLAVQKSVLDGLVRSQLREADRLRARHGDEDPRVASSLQRAQRFDTLRVQAASHAEVAGRLAETFQRDGLFHGYVLQADGSPAAGLTVKIGLRGGTDRKQQRNLRGGSAKTDSSGYFRVELSASIKDSDSSAPALQRWVKHAAHALLQEIDETPSGAGGSPSAAAAPVPPAATDGTGTAPGSTEPVSTVEVFDASARLVFQDPIPPRFDDLGSEFRYYTLDYTRTAASEGKTARKKR